MTNVYVLGIVTLAFGFMSSVFALPAGAAEPPRVVISEINWGGSGRSAADEWLELRNLGGTPVDVGGWAIGGAATGEQAIALAAGTVIDADGVLLIANYSSGDSSTLAVVPHLVSTAVSLPNTKLDIALLMPDGTLVDSLNDPGTPDFGSTTPVFASMERDLTSLAWYTATASANLVDATQLGTPGVAYAASIASPPVMGESERATEAIAITADPVIDEVISGEEIAETPAIVPEAPVAPEETAAAPEFVVDATREEVIVESVVAPATAEEVVEEVPAVIEEALMADATTATPESTAVPEQVAIAVEETAVPVAETIVESTEVTPDAAVADDIVIPETAEPVQEAVSAAATVVVATETTSVALPTLGTILLNELLSAPTEGDEWIELYNADSAAIDVSDWQVRDASGKATALSCSIAPGGYLVITKPLGKLNNDGDTVELIAPDGSVVDRMMYGTDAVPAPKQDKSLSRQGDMWLITDAATPGTANTAPTSAVAVEVKPEKSRATSSAETYVAAFEPDPAATTAATASVATDDAVVAEAAHVIYTLVATATKPATAAKAKTTKSSAERTAPSARSITSLDGVADDVLVAYEGTLLALPGIFGSQVAALEGAMLYMYSAEWPVLAIGDVIRVTGTTSTAHGEQRIKLADASAITVIRHEDAMAAPYDGSENAVTPQLVSAHGTVLTREGKTLTLLVDGNERTVEANERTGIVWSTLDSTTLTVTGVLRRVDGALVLMPRNQDDVVVETVIAPYVPATSSHSMPTKPIVGAALFVGALGILGYWFTKSRTLIPSV